MSQIRAMEEATKKLLEQLDPKTYREGLRDTPERVARAWTEWTAGYDVDIEALFTTFDDGSEDYDQMIIVKDIPFYSHCEHHLALFQGSATIAYVPGERIVGISKFARLVDAYACRLLVQERMTTQIAKAIDYYLKPIGVAVLIEAEHTCMSSRGVKKPGTRTLTSALKGCFKTEPACRAEFYSLIGR